MGWVAAFLVGLLGWVLVRDVRGRETALALIRAHRDDQPRAYWAIMGFWLICLLVCAFLTLGAYIGDTCRETNPCVVIIKAPPQ